MKEEKLNGILKIIEGMPKYEWDRIAHEVNKAYSHKTVKVELDSHNLNETRVDSVIHIINFNVDVVEIEQVIDLFFIPKVYICICVINYNII